MKTIVNILVGKKILAGMGEAVDMQPCWQPVMKYRTPIKTLCIWFSLTPNRY